MTEHSIYNILGFNPQKRVDTKNLKSTARLQRSRSLWKNGREGGSGKDVL